METNVIYIATVSVVYKNSHNHEVYDATKKYFKDEKSATDWALSLYTKYINDKASYANWCIEKETLN